MAYITKKEEDVLLNIEQYVFTALNFKRESFESVEEFVKLYADYQALWNLNERLQNDRKISNEKSKEGMRRYRKDNPEAKEKAKLYMRKYNKRRKEAK